MGDLSIQIWTKNRVRAKNDNTLRDVHIYKKIKTHYAELNRFAAREFRCLAVSESEHKFPTGSALSKYIFNIISLNLLEWNIFILIQHNSLIHLSFRFSLLVICVSIAFNGYSDLTPTYDGIPFDGSLFIPYSRWNATRWNNFLVYFQTSTC